LAGWKRNWTGSKKKWDLSLEERRALIAPHPKLSLRRQCQLLDLHRSGLFYEPAPVRARELDLRARLDRIYTAHPEYGVRRMVLGLAEEGRMVNAKCVRRLLREMGLEAVYPKPRLTIAGPQAGRFPYLLRGVAIARAHQVWAADITYIALPGGWAYLLAVMDWFSRYVLAWALSATRDSLLGVAVWREALAVAGRAPEIMNTDQGAEFSSGEWITSVQQSGARVSQDGRGRALDNVMVERLWRTVKWDHLYLHDYASLPATRRGLGGFFPYYNERRWHQGLGNRTPHEVLYGTTKKRAGGAGGSR
jgi:putative transposase